MIEFFRKNIPRNFILLIDLAICFFSLVLAYLLRFNFSSIPQVEVDSFPVVFPIVLGTRLASFYLARLHKSIIRYTGSRDIQRIFLVMITGSVIFSLFNILSFALEAIFIIPFSIVIVEFMGSSFLMISLRLVYKSLYFEYTNPSREKTSVIIFGAGESGIITKRALDRDAGTKYKVTAFVDDDHKKAGRKLEGVTIHPSSKLEDILQKNNVAHFIISVQDILPHRKQELIDTCLKYKTNILNVPPVSRWINGELSFKQIKKVKIEDLLERDPIRLDEKVILQELSGRTILITGAAGSIGSEIARQVMKYKPGLVLLLDQAESPLYEVENEISGHYPDGRFETVVADVRNASRMENAFRTFQPQIVFHAAAYKHVPMMELNPSESILTNILGSKITADLSVKYRVEKFVMISTDKAVNPTSVMGASKRTAEIYTQALGKKSEVKFITTRFGNVLGSNGSVIPRFRQQIEKGGPITVTHPEITRYFMTIQEACQLVLEAGAMGKGGEIFIFDMGKLVKIVDLAKKMVQLSGLTIDKDIMIKFTGLRPGEKLYEELLANTENTLPTHHPQIMIAKVQEYDYETVSKEIESLIKLFDKQDNVAIVSKLKQIVPEYKSNNSIFEEIDKKMKNV